MGDLDAVFLSRLQFAWVIAFHILLPAFTVGLASYIALLEGLHLKTGNANYLRISNLWIKIFAISFGMGVVSGIVMPFQFGTNWSRFSDLTANVISPLMGYEVLTAFFLEAGFLGVLLFGRHLVPAWAHFASALMVAVGTLLSPFWILAANSWMQTPQGHQIIDGRFFPVDWWQIVFTPSFPFRLAHTVTGFFVTTAFVVVGVAAYYLRQGRFQSESRMMFSMTLWLLTVLVPLQIVIGDLHGLNTLEHQPTKVAAMEGNWDQPKGAPFVVFGWPDERNERNAAEISIPKASSLILRHSLEGEVPTLKQVPPEQRPPVAIVFFAFRIMLGVGFLMLALVVVGGVLRARGRLYEAGWFLKMCQWSAPLGFVAVIAGWTTTEVGRQPWTVYGLLRTVDSVTPFLQARDVLISLAIYMLVYVLVYPAGVLFMLRIIWRGPDDAEAVRQPVAAGRPESPVDALGEVRPVEGRSA